jgi:hypothetical protein
MTPTPPYKVADEPTLKPCPFCGGDARRNQAGEWFGTGCDGSTKCPAFLSGLMYRTQDEADAAWNRRASPALAPTDEAWRPIESAPRNVLILGWDEDMGHIVTRIPNNAQPDDWVPSHWMPLPDAPKVDTSTPSGDQNSVKG